MPRLLATADIALAPYAGDAPDYFSPLKLFEYLAAGLATIAADLPGVRDVVAAETAALVPQGDAHALADAVSALVSDPARRRALGEAGRALVLAHHTWRHRAHTILELVAGARPPPDGGGRMKHRPTRILAPYLKKEWKAFAVATLATILITAAELAGPVPLALVVDQLLEDVGPPPAASS